MFYKIVMNITKNSYKVVKLTHLKAQNYEVAILAPDGQVLLFPVHEELVLKFRLVNGKELDESQIIELNGKLDLGRAYQYALNLLSRKSYTTAQIYEKLEAKEYTIDIIQEVLKRLVDVGLLNDEQYAITYINHQSIMGKKGPNKIKQELLQKGISERIIQKYLNLYEEENQLEHAIKLANQLVRNNRKYGPHFIKQKIHQYLMTKGFNHSIIEAALSTIDFGDFETGENPILIKEIEKLCRKYSRLTGYEKKTKVIQSLMRKGFNYDDISSIYQRVNEELEDEE